jgi:hypothetical protein
VTAHQRQELDQRLTMLTADCGAACSFVLDTTGQAYGTSSPLPEDWATLAQEAGLLVVAATREHPLRKGGHLHLLRSVEPPFAAAESFAGVYMVLLLFDGPFDGARVSALVRHALPEIEALTVSLPPPDPTREAKVAGMRAG